MIRRSAAALLALAVGGCIGPRPAAPPETTIVPPPAWRTALGPGEPIRADWWSALGDPVLTALVGHALAANPDLGAAAARIEEARAQERLSRAQLFPLVNATASAGFAPACCMCWPTTDIGFQRGTKRLQNSMWSPRMRRAPGSARRKNMWLAT